MHDTSSNESERVIDVRELNHRVRHTVISSLFEHLGQDGSLQLIVDHAPEPLRFQFAAKYGDRCEWTYLEEGPDVWRVRLRRGGDPTGEPQPLLPSDNGPRTRTGGSHEDTRQVTRGHQRSL